MSHEFDREYHVFRGAFSNASRKMLFFRRATFLFRAEWSGLNSVGAEEARVNE